MKISLPTVATLWCAEMRMVLRDRRTLVASVLLPLLVMPMLLLAMSWVHRQRAEHLETTVYRYAVVGSQAEAARALIARSGASQRAEELGEPVREDPMAALDAGKVHLVIEALSAEEYDARTAANRVEATGADGVGTLDSGPTDFGEGEPLAGALVIRIVFRADRDDSTAGMQRMVRWLQDVRHAERVALLEAQGFGLSPGEIAAVEEVNVASERQVAGLTLGRMLTLFLLFLLLPSAAVVATDSLAGEKERGTLETLLTCAVGRVEIITAKHLSILAVTIGITLIQAGNLLVYVGLDLIPLPAGLSAAITPGVALLLAALYLPLAALVAGVLLVTSGYAKSYKEAQLYFMPVFLVGMIPALAPFLPGLSLRSIVVLVPVANLSLAVREVLTGQFDWPMIAMAWLVTGMAAVWVMRLGVRSLAVENLVSGSGREMPVVTGGTVLFERHVLRWYAVLWAALLIVSGYYSPTTDLRIQAVINLVVLILGASVFLLWRYRLDPAATLGLRLPRPMVWPGVLLGVAGGMLTGIGVFRLADQFIPVPPQVIEAFGRSLLVDEMPLWQLLFFLALLPGIIEEVAFRGVLLHGLHRRMRPVALVVVVGLIFGLFHVSLFRILPTAFLGILLAIVTLQTGSLYPAIIWHVLHNALSVLAGYHDLPLHNLDPSLHFAAAGVLAAGFWIIWRHRTPYPGLRCWRRPAPASCA